jgi:hypothetical protein
LLLQVTGHVRLSWLVMPYMLHFDAEFVLVQSHKKFGGLMFQRYFFIDTAFHHTQQPCVSYKLVS